MSAFSDKQNLDETRLAIAMTAARVRNISSTCRFLRADWLKRELEGVEGVPSELLPAHGLPPAEWLRRAERYEASS